MVKFYYLVIIPFLLFLSCSDDGTTEPVKNFDVKLLHSDYIKAWNLEEWLIDGVKVADPSETDIILLLDKLGGGIFANGELDNPEKEELTFDSFDYEFINGNKLKFSNIITFTPFLNSTEIKILDLTESRMSIEIVSTIDSKKNIHKMFFTRLTTNNPNAEANNYSLSRGDSKLWKVASVYIDDVQVKNTCYRDDMFLYSTNGSAIMLMDYVKCDESEFVRNDIFSWELIDNGRKMIRKTMHESWNFMQENESISTDTISIIKLTAEEFEYEFIKKTNPQSKMRVTLVPYIR